MPSESPETSAGGNPVERGALLRFKGVEDYDVYNCSVPFTYEGRLHIYARLEERLAESESRVRLFVETGQDEFTLVPDRLNFHLEDPFISKIQGVMFFGGTRAIKNCGKVSLVYTDFYKGSAERPFYYTSGPDGMRYVRLVELSEGNVGVFGIYRSADRYAPSFTVIPKLDDLNMDIIAKADPLNFEAFPEGSYGVHQAYLLSTGEIGCIGHQTYEKKDIGGTPYTVFRITAFVLDPRTRRVMDSRIIATRNSFPECPSKSQTARDCAFASGITMRKDGRCDLYSGLGNTHEGRIAIDYPFEGHGHLREKELTF